MAKLPEHVSESTRKLNPHIYGGGPATQGEPRHATTDATHLGKVAAPPLRQSSKPKCNKTEAEFGAWLRRTLPDVFIVAQDITFRLANGLRYTPDFMVYNSFTGNLFAYEVKGERRKDSRWATDDSKAKLKTAARLFAWITWTIVWKENGEWKSQRVEENT
jgi:hypothetical protein